MPLGLFINVIVALVITGLLLWAVDQIPMDGTIKAILRVVVIVVVCLYLLYFLVGLIPGGAVYFPHR